MKTKHKITMHDIAKELNISVGTVHRALHDTGRVSKETQEKVLAMAKKTGYQLNYTARALRKGPIHICVVVCCLVPQYLNEIKRGMESAFDELASANVIPHFHFYARDIESYTQEILDVMHDCIENDYSGIVLSLPYGSSKPYLAAIEKINQKGIAVATVMSDIPEIQRVLTVTPNGNCAGKLAAELLHLRCANEKIAILTTNRDIDIHRLYLEGFLNYMNPLPFEDVLILEHNDDRARLMEQLEMVTTGKDKVGGVYITSANSVAVYEYIQQKNLPKDLKMVTTDLLAETKELLARKIAFATIFQDPFRQGKIVINNLHRYLIEGTGGGEELVTPQAVFRSNMHLQN